MSQTLPAISVIDEKLCTSAQPLADDLARLGETGLQHVINLALPTSDNAVANEAALLAAQRINYVQIPVIWENPTPEQFTLFSQVLWAMREGNVLVHCACNMRASAFVFLYRVLHEAVSLHEAALTMHLIWRPEGVWREFITQQLAEQDINYSEVRADA